VEVWEMWEVREVWEAIVKSRTRLKPTAQTHRTRLKPRVGAEGSQGGGGDDGGGGVCSGQDAVA